MRVRVGLIPRFTATQSVGSHWENRVIRPERWHSLPQKLPYAASVRLRMRTNGTVAYDVRYRADGSSRSYSFDTSDAAERWANILRHIGPAEALALLSIETKGLPTVSEYAHRYISTKSGVEGRTTDKYRSYMRVSIGPSLGPLPLTASPHG
jgi:integrase